MTHSTNPSAPLDSDEDDLSGDEPDEMVRQLGRDARRLCRGELSEEAFYERYHDDIVARFGFDRRPVGDSK